MENVRNRARPVTAVSRRKSGELSQTFQTLEKIWDEYGVYEKPQDEES